jgi:hypothetical protein
MKASRSGGRVRVGMRPCRAPWETNAILTLASPRLQPNSRADAVPARPLSWPGASRQLLTVAGLGLLRVTGRVAPVKAPVAASLSNFSNTEDLHNRSRTIDGSSLVLARARSPLTTSQPPHSLFGRTYQHARDVRRRRGGRRAQQGRGIAGLRNHEAFSVNTVRGGNFGLYAHPRFWTPSPRPSPKPPVFSPSRRKFCRQT